MGQVSRQMAPRGYDFAGRKGGWEFCPAGTSLAAKYASALSAALGYVAIPFGLYLSEVAVASARMLVVYFVCAIGLLSFVGAYIAGSLIKGMVSERCDRPGNREAGLSIAPEHAVIGVDSPQDQVE